MLKKWEAYIHRKCGGGAWERSTALKDNFLSLSFYYKRGIGSDCFVYTKQTGENFAKLKDFK